MFFFQFHFSKKKMVKMEGSFQKNGVAELGRVIGVKEKVACSG